MPRPKVTALSPALCQSKRDCRAGRVRKVAPAQRQRGDAERDIDGEQIRPGSDRQNAGGDRRSDRGGYRDHQRIDADATPEQGARIGVADQRRVDAHDPGRAKSLHDARHRQQQQGMRQRAEQRCEREQQQSRQIDAAIADDFAERSQRQQRDRDRQLIAVDDPDRKRRAGVEILGDRGQRDIGDGAVHHRHDKAERDGEDGPIALRLGQAIGVFDDGGRHVVDALSVPRSTGYRNPRSAATCNCEGPRWFRPRRSASRGPRSGEAGRGRHCLSSRQYAARPGVCRLSAGHRFLMHPRPGVAGYLQPSPSSSSMRRCSCRFFFSLLRSRSSRSETGSS